MKKLKEIALTEFIGEELENPSKNNNKQVVIDEREGLIERVDKIYVTKDGKQLLREQY